MLHMSTKDHEVFYKLCKWKVFVGVFFSFFLLHFAIFLLNIESGLFLCVCVGKVGLCFKEGTRPIPKTVESEFEVNPFQSVQF